MELPVIVEWVRIFGGNFALLSCNLNVYSERYSEDLEDIIEPYISKKYHTFTITANVANDEEIQGGQYIFIGDFITHPKFGQQFKAEFYYQDVPATDEGLKSFLMTLPNIKEKRSEAIVAKFGVKGTFDVLNNNIYRLAEINGVTTQRIPAIEKAWQEKKCMRELYEFFVSKGLPIKMADAAYKQWGQLAKKTIETNPYCLVELRGVGFITADQEAHKIMAVIADDYRTTACMKYVLQEQLNANSNLCVPYKEFKRCILLVIQKCDDALGKTTDLKLYMDLIPKCLKSNLDTFVAVKDIETNNVYIYLKNIWEKEKYITTSLYERSKSTYLKSACTVTDLIKAEADVSVFCGTKIELDECQKQAIQTPFDHKVSIITGAGGTGKSMICRCICELARSKGMSIRLMSPTGKAAQVLESKTGFEASTIHRGLKMKPCDDIPREIIIEDILLVDEISMCGIDTMYAMLKAIDGNAVANLVFVGDKNQLPSVSPGNFLSDIIDSGCANVVTLDKIHRQSEGSYISIVANDIAKGKVVGIPEKAEDIIWHDLNVGNFHTELLDSLDVYLKQNKMDDLQIMSPMKKGDCGVYKINEIMQVKMAEVNGTTEECMGRKFGKFYIGDRVIQTENNYDKMIFNGDMGLIKDLGGRVRDPRIDDKEEKFITVDFYGEEVTFYGSEIDQLQLAWCITVHKFQGSQSKNIIFVMANEAQIMMSKELVYTALTRAERKLDIYGHMGMLRIAPTKSIVKKRYTNFSRILDGLRTGKKILQVLEKK